MNIFSQNRILKWNVSIMVILILLACSLMGILTVVFLKSLITYTDDTYSYHKSYYIAKAWLELALTEIDNSAMWFSQEIISGNTINDNFECVWCNFRSHILWRSGFISNDFWENDTCTQTGALVLQPWQSLTIPMFYDKTSSFDKILSGDYYEIDRLWSHKEDLWLSCPNNNCPNVELNVWVIFQSWGLDGDISWEYLYMTGIYANNTTFFTTYFNGFWHVYTNIPNNLYPYIIVSNPSEVIVRFCIKDSYNLWPTTKYFISSLWEYMWKTVWLQAIYAQPTPSFFINPYSSYWWDWSSMSMEYENSY